jgi:hypothetical protein
LNYFYFFFILKNFYFKKGGRIEDPQDQVLLSYLLKNLLNEKLLDEDFKVDGQNRYPVPNLIKSNTKFWLDHEKMIE